MSIGKCFENSQISQPSSLTSMNISRLLEGLLCRVPRVYDSCLLLMGNPSLEKRVFLQIVRQGDVVCDIGANRGYFSKLFYHLVGASGAVHAFEPVEPTFKRLADSLSFANTGRLALNHQAVGDREGSIEIFMPNGDDGQASLGRHTDGSWQKGNEVARYECAITTLDAYSRKVGLKRLDFVKIDIEGAELLALRGARETLLRFKPWLCMEMEPDWMKAFAATPEKIAEELQACGYDEAFLMQDALKPISLGRRPLLPVTFTGCANLLCVGSEGRREEMLKRVGLLPA